MHEEKLRLWNGMDSGRNSVNGEWSRLLSILAVVGLLALVALSPIASAPSNWYNPEREDHDVNHDIDYVQSLAVTNSEDYYSNTSGHCAIGQIGQNTSRVFYQWYIANANNCRTEGSSVLRSQRERQIRNKSSGESEDLSEITFQRNVIRSEGASFRNNQSLYEYTWGNITESEVLYLNFDEGEGSIVYDKSGKGNDGTLTNMDPGTDWVTGKFGYGLDFDIANVKFSINREPEGNCSFAAIYEKCEAFPISPFGVDVAERLCRSDICLICEANQPHDYVDCVTLSLNNKEL